MIEEVVTAGKAVLAAVLVLEKELEIIKLKPKEREHIQTVRLQLTIALHHCRSAWKDCKGLSLLRDRAAAEVERKEGDRNG